MSKQDEGLGSAIINELLEDCLLALPVNGMLISLYQQHQQRGFLTKKQLQGLYAKASGIPGMHTGRLATLEAMIKKLPDRYKSSLPSPAPVYEKDAASGERISAILRKYPAHKRVLFLQAKYETNDPLTTQEMDELKKFAAALLK